jgi:uncharacterized membrane protein YqjE
MITYLLLIVAFGVIALVSIGILIFGLIKKRKNILITAAILFIIGVIGCVYSGLEYSKRLYNYVTSNEFQQDTKKYPIEQPHIANDLIG